MQALTWNTALQIFIAIVAFVMVLDSVRSASKHRDLIQKIWKRVRFRMFVESLLILVITIAIALTIRNQWEFSHISWTRLLVSDGGSVFKAPMTLARESGHWWAMLLPIALFALLIFFVPVLAKFEEDVFRKGAESWGKIIHRSFWFGLVHMVMGIPLYVALALICAGLFYGYQYKRAFDRFIRDFSLETARTEAVLVASAYHTAYNTIVFGVAVAMLFYMAFLMSLL